MNPTAVAGRARLAAISLAVGHALLQFDWLIYPVKAVLFPHAQTVANRFVAGRVLPRSLRNLGSEVVVDASVLAG